MTDGEAWLDALGDQLRQNEEQIPALAAVRSKLVRVNESVFGFCCLHGPARPTTRGSRQCLALGLYFPPLHTS